jgi:hypothetical protein
MGDYMIVRFFADDRPREIRQRGLTLIEAKAWCARSDTKGQDWFDGYTKED